MFAFCFKRIRARCIHIPTKSYYYYHYHHRHIFINMRSPQGNFIPREHIMRLLYQITYNLTKKFGNWATFFLLRLVTSFCRVEVGYLYTMICV